MFCKPDGRWEKREAEEVSTCVRLVCECDRREDGGSRLGHAVRCGIADAASSLGAAWTAESGLVRMACRMVGSAGDSGGGPPAEPPRTVPGAQKEDPAVPFVYSTDCPRCCFTDGSCAAWEEAAAEVLGSSDASWVCTKLAAAAHRSNSRTSTHTALMVGACACVCARRCTSGTAPSNSSMRADKC